MCIHRRSFLHSVLQNSCLNRQQSRIKANTVNRKVSWSWSQTAQATRQVLLHLQVKRTRLSGNASSDLKTLLITQPLLPRFTSRRHPNPKSKTTNLADYLFCQTVRQATSKSLQANQLVPQFTSLRHLNRKTKMAKPANDHACQTLRQVTPKSCQAQPLVPRFTFPRHLNRTTKIAEPYFQGENLTPSDFKSYRQA